MKCAQDAKGKGHDMFLCVSGAVLWKCPSRTEKV